MKQNLLLFFVLISPFSLFSQKIDFKSNDLDMKQILKSIFIDKDSVKKREDQSKIAFSLMPAPDMKSSEGGIVVSFVTTFYMDENHDSTKMSEVYFTPTTSFTGQYSFPVQSYIYTKDNKYNFIGDYRFMIYPQFTYGLGGNSSKEPQSEVDYHQIRFYQFISRKIKGDFRLGLGFQLDKYESISEDSEIDVPTDFYKYQQGNYSDELSSGIAFQALYDSRKNILNANQGYYVEIDYRINSNVFGSDTNWQSLYVDARKYHSLSEIRHKVLATRLFYWAVFDGKPHYLDLPSVGWDRYGKTGRGFTRNRYRSNSLLYMEAEYRTDITRNGFLGAVFYGNLSSVSDLDTYRFDNWTPAIGTGLRIKWNKINDCNLTIDYGISKDDWTFRVGLSENF
ncbi:BamA/TamA family outer membrane protein [Flavobacterium sp.]|uniref:BamA/TamA family outer membrane protein n=1 Tax=Flavobacterium sp. TaxID=239 RepID=UPI002CACD062|nr:BamA/TamA family outer membrane protein [Flavobacterium sp.]HSD08410.1 BamA/TamA family outer membrane protein [Flavobacterium sp.]